MYPSESTWDTSDSNPELSKRHHSSTCFVNTKILKETGLNLSSSGHLPFPDDNNDDNYLLIT